MQSSYCMIFYNACKYFLHYNFMFLFTFPFPTIFPSFASNYLILRF